MTRAARLGRAFALSERVHDPAAATAAEVMALAEADLDVGDLGSDDATTVRVQARIITSLLYAGSGEKLDELLRGAQAAAKARGRLLAESTTSSLLALSRLWAGALAEAETESRRALTVMAGRPWAEPTATLVLLTEALLAQGRTREAAAVQSDASARPARRGLIGVLVLESQGRLRMALGQTRHGLDAFILAGREADRCAITNPALTSWRAEAAVALASMGRSPEARALAADNLTAARSFGAPRPLGMALHAAGVAAERTERVALLSEAVTVLEETSGRLELARALVELGSALRHTGQKGLARDVLRRGAHVASVCRAGDVVAAAQRELRGAGARPRRLALTGIDALTPAELRVAGLASTGQTNAAIAKELFVTEKTIEGHLARAYQKLEIHARWELGAALAVPPGLSMIRPGRDSRGPAPSDPGDVSGQAM